METRDVFLLSVFGILAILFVLHLLLKEKSPGPLDRLKAMSEAAKARAKEVVLKEGQFVLIIFDWDEGSLHAYGPDPAPKVVDSYDEALAILKNDASDDLEYFFLNAKIEILATRSERGEITTL